MQDQKTLGICVIITTLFVLSQGLTMTHLQGPPPPVAYTTWDYINTRVMIRDHCYHALDTDLQKTNKLTDGTTFTWSPNKLHLGNGTCGEIDITFNLVDKAFTFVSSNPPNAPWPCGNSDHPELQGYIQRIAKANHLALDSNVIQFVTLGNPKVNNLAIADKPKWSEYTIHLKSSYLSLI